MKPTKRISAAERNRAVRRLRSITVGTALAAIAASGAFAGIAAASWSGNPTADVVPADSTGTDTTTTTDDTTTTDTSSSTTTGQPTATPTIRPAATPATTTTSGGQVTTGGS